MWVAFESNPYDGSWNHTYFRNKEKCKMFVDKKNADPNEWDDWGMLEIEFEDDKE